MLRTSDGPQGRDNHRRSCARVTQMPGEGVRTVDLLEVGEQDLFHKSAGKHHVVTLPCLPQRLRVCRRAGEGGDREEMVVEEACVCVFVC